MLAPIFLLFSLVINAQDDLAESWEQCTSVKDVYHLYPDRIRNLFHKLDLDHPGLEEVCSALDSGNYPLACNRLVNYYREKAVDHFHNVKGGDYNKEIANNALEDTFTITAYTAKVPRTEDGGLNWYWVPPDYYNNQWHQLTRHGWWNDLLHAWLETGNAEFVRYLDQIIRDWCTHQQRYNVFRINGPNGYEATDKHIWGDRLDAGIRVRRWPRVFYSMMSSEHFHDATILLMLNSISRHGDYIEDTWKTGNHLIIEMTGLMNMGISFPEFEDAESWISQAKNTLIEEWVKQILPDGAQYELAHGYHQVVMRLYFQFKELFNKSGRKFPEKLNEKMEKGVNYTAYVLNPRQMGLMNNDSPEHYQKDWLLDKAEMYNRPDWKYIATNGSIGKKPEGSPSIIFPWAGHFVTRSSWKKDAHWAFFDVGPWGKGHQHNDKLHVSVYAHGRRLLVDNGKYTYKSGKWRSYYRGSQGHNVLMVNRNGQNRYRELYDTAFKNYEIKENVDFCMGSFSDGWKNGHKGKHTRALVYIRDKYWLVFDRMDVGNNKIQVLWHFHPECHVVKSTQEVKSDDEGKANLLIRPIFHQKWELELERGETDPIQGWYSKNRGYKNPAYCAEYETKLNGIQTFAWLLFPKDGKIMENEVSTKIIAQTEDYMCVQVKESGKDPLEITVNFSAKQVEEKYSVVNLSE